MKKYIVAIEEVLVKEFEVSAETREAAMRIAAEKYKNEIFVLTPGEVQSKRMAILEPMDGTTEWCEF